MRRPLKWSAGPVRQAVAPHPRGAYPASHQDDLRLRHDRRGRRAHAPRSKKHNAKRRTMTRAEYEGNSLSRAKPWEAEGIFTAEPGSEGGRRPPQVPGRRKCASQISLPISAQLRHRAKPHHRGQRWGAWASGGAGQLATTKLQCSRAELVDGRAALLPLREAARLFNLMMHRTRQEVAPHEDGILKESANFRHHRVRSKQTVTESFKTPAWPVGVRTMPFQQYAPFFSARRSLRPSRLPSMPLGKS